MKSIYRFFDGIAHHTRALAVVLAVSLGVLMAAALLMGRREQSSAEARNGIFLAEKAHETELKALMPPPAKPEDAKDAKGAKKPPAPQPGVEFTALDVNTKFPQTVKAYREVIDRFKGTRSAFDARMALGHLYLEHGQAAQAEELFAPATQSAPRGMERGLALMALGLSREAQGKLKEASESFDQAVATGEEAVKGDALMALARTEEALHDTAKARATYDQVISQLPNTEQARNAEIYKSQL
jgi:TolA-binding protein